jgi:hypothetical protein
VATWEYCQLRGGDAGLQVAYYSADLNIDVDNDVLRDNFSDLEDALAYLGDEGWEAFHIDAAGNWFLKRPDDWDEDWDDDYDEEDE